MGVCIDGACHYDNTTCSDDLDCPDGYVCQYYDALVPRPCDPATDVDCVPVPSGVCVPAPRVCETHDDCALGGVNAWCVNGECVWEVDCDPNHAACDMIPPTCPDGEVPSVVGGCFGPCVPEEACMPIIPGCADDSQCGPDEKCIAECWDCIPEDPTCVGGCEGYCQPVGDECLKDADCTDPAGLQGYCVSGWCYYEPPYCFTDSDCPEGQTCILDDTYCGRAPGDTPIWCGGYCSGAPPPSDCFRTGCSLEFCSDQAVDTPCNYLPEYACYDRAVCERQAGGACGWTMTPDAEQCFADFDYPDPGNP
jgi:Cys-rich repeat protein